MISDRDCDSNSNLFIDFYVVGILCLVGFVEEA
jgi:hypothetical protein